MVHHALVREERVVLGHVHAKRVDDHSRLLVADARFATGRLARADGQRDERRFLDVAELKLLVGGILWLARDQVQPELLLGFQLGGLQAGCFAERADLVERVGAHVPVAHEVGERHLRVVHEPQDGRGGRVVAQDQLAAGAKHARDPAEERLRVGVVVEAVRADDGVEARVVERQVLGVAHDEARAFDALRACHLDHLGRQVESRVAPARQL